MGSNSNQHSAAGSATGYLYQARVALLGALREIQTRPHLTVSIELFDDVAFDSEGSPVERIQTKHHAPNAGNLTDRSVDLWKTTGIWSKQMTNDSQTSSRTQFILLTTGRAPDGSAASFLRERNRDMSAASDALSRAARESINEETESARKWFDGLSEAHKTSLLEAVVVLDSSANISDTKKEMRSEIYYVAPRQHLDGFIERLEGWWFDRIVEGLRCGYCSIPLTEIEDKIRELQEGLGRDTLPIDCESMVVPPELEHDFDKRTFVKQLRLIKVGDARISYAIRDFYRAFEQRSRWIRDELLFDPEISRYELALQEAWQSLFAEAREDLGDDDQEERKIELGRAIFRWVEREADVPLRNLRHRFLCNGSFHMLADILRVGWHPDFEALFQHDSLGDELIPDPKAA